MMSDLEMYYNEHAAQARQHEGQRERMTSIILAIGGTLVGLITYSELSPWSLPAAFTITLLGAFGFVFAGKHYERFRFHSAIMGAIRDEMDHHAEPDRSAVSLSDLRKAGGSNHYKNFTWPQFGKTRDKDQADARSWIARQRLHNFWEAVHILVASLGLALMIGITIKVFVSTNKEPLKVRLVDDQSARTSTNLVLPVTRPAPLPSPSFGEPEPKFDRAKPPR
jgi:hypothetical protein